MSHKPTKNNGVISSELLARINRDFDDWLPMSDRPLYPEDVISLADVNMRLRERTYIVCFADIFKTIRRHEDLFYFYPCELEGLIESCVVATQREQSLRQRDASLFREINDAMEDWRQREDEAAFSQAFTIGLYSDVRDYEIGEAVKAAGTVDDMVRQRMDFFNDLLGEYAVDQSSLTWTELKALSMRLSY